MSIYIDSYKAISKVQGLFVDVNARNLTREIGNRMPLLSFVKNQLPSSEKSFSLENCNLGYWGNVSGESVIKVLPRSLEMLSLKQNYLGSTYSQSGVFGRIVAELPPSLTHIDLSHNNLGAIRGSETIKSLAEAFASLPPSVVYINLKDNELYSLSDANLKKVFSPFVNTNKIIEIEVESYVAERLNKIFSETIISPKKISILSAEISTAQPKARIEPYKFIMSYLQSNRKQPLTLREFLSSEKKDSNLAQNITPFLLRSIATAEIADKRLPPQKRVQLNKFSDIPEIKAAKELLSENLNLDQALPDICLQIIKEKKSLRVQYLLAELPGESLNKIILQLCKHPRGPEAAELIGFLTNHLCVYDKFQPLIMDKNPEFRKILITHLEWITENPTNTINAEEADKMIEQIKETSPICELNSSSKKL